MTDYPDGRPAKTPEELVDLYEGLAPKFALFDRIDRLLTGRYRKRLFSRSEGRVLDVACGTGLNFPYLPEDTDVTGVDLSPAMLTRARERASALGIDADLCQVDAVALPFAEESFDTVISSLSTCTFSEPVAVLREMDRVCRSGGRILLLEHGRSSVASVARLQDWWAPVHFEKTGCRWNQNPPALAAEAGFDSISVRRRLGGIVTTMEIRPTANGRRIADRPGEKSETGDRSESHRHWQ